MAQFYTTRNPKQIGSIKRKVSFPSWLPVHALRVIFGAFLEYGGKARLVGGCVRDILLHKESFDIDIACTLVPGKMIEVLKNKKHNLNKKITVIPTGIKHGTITVLYDGFSFEITTLRSDIECFGRDAKIKYTTSWLEDSERRDFTINAMYLDLDGNLYDYHNGIEHLKEKKVQFIGDPQTRIKEDYLRILRYFRFLSYYGIKNIDIRSLKSVKPNVKFIDEISGERIQQEFKKIFQGKYALDSIQLMESLNVLHAIFNAHLKYGAKMKFRFQGSNVQQNNFGAALASLIYNLQLDSKRNTTFTLLIEHARARLKLSNAHYQFIKHALYDILEYKDTEAFHKKYMYFKGKKHYLSFLIFLKHIGRRSTRTCSNWTPPIIPIKANDLKKLGFHDKALGVELKKLELIWVESNFQASKKDLLEKI